MSKCTYDDRCEECPRSGHFVWPWGNPGSETAIIGDQPALDHKSTGSECAFAMDLADAPRSKRVLVSVFAAMGKSLDNYYWTNAHKCAVNMSFDTERACKVMLQDELQDFETLVCLGNNSANAVSGISVTGDIEQVWHPAYILRRPERFDEYVEQWNGTLKEGHHTLDQF